MSAPRSKYEWHRIAVDRSDELKPTAFRVLMAIFDYSDRGGANAYPSISTLAERLNLDTRNVKRAIKDLREAGWIVTTSQGGHIDGKNQATVYRLGIPPEGVVESTTRGWSNLHKGGGKNSHPNRPSNRSSEYSEGKPSASPASGDGAKVIQPNVRDWSKFEDLENIEQWLDNKLDGWRGDHVLETAVWMMWEDDRHPKAILNYACSRMGYKLKAA